MSFTHQGTREHKINTTAARCVVPQPKQLQARGSDSPISGGVKWNPRCLGFRIWRWIFRCFFSSQFFMEVEWNDRKGNQIFHFSFGKFVSEFIRSSHCEAMTLPYCPFASSNKRSKRSCGSGDGGEKIKCENVYIFVWSILDDPRKPPPHPASTGLTEK